MNYDDYTDYENEMPWGNNAPESNTDDNSDGVTRIMEEDHYDTYNFFPDAGF